MTSSRYGVEHKKGDVKTRCDVPKKLRVGS